MNKKIIAFFSFLVLLASPVIALAAPGPAATWFNSIICNFLTIVVWPIFLGVSVLMIIFAGYKFLTANGEPGKVSEAKKAVIWALVGIIVAVLAFSAVGVIDKVLNANSTTALSCPSGS